MNGVDRRSDLVPSEVRGSDARSLPRLHQRGRVLERAERGGELIITARFIPAGRLVVYDNKSPKAIEPKLELAIGVIEDPALPCSGALWVQGGIPIESADGKRYEVRNRVTLCRCGVSANKPFCNGGHASIGFDDGMIPR